VSDALDIARWCWPEGTWKLRAGKTGLGVFAVRVDDYLRTPAGESGGVPIYECSAQTTFQQGSVHDVAAAEAVVIERGLAKAYGCALLTELSQEQLEGFSGFEELARIATAPLAARVRALAAVVRKATT
jgi:hypothetical protein